MISHKANVGKWPASYSTLTSAGVESMGRAPLRLLRLKCPGQWALPRAGMTPRATEVGGAQSESRFARKLRSSTKAKPDRALPPRPAPGPPTAHRDTGPLAVGPGRLGAAAPAELHGHGQASSLAA